MEWQIYRAIGVFEHKNNVRDHYYCVKEIFDLYKSKQQLSELSQRADIDTVCAFDLYKMKQFATQGLDYADYHPELNNIKIP